MLSLKLCCLLHRVCQLTLWWLCADYLQHDADAFAFMYDNISSKFGSSFPSRRRW